MQLLYTAMKEDFYL